MVIPILLRIIPVSLLELSQYTFMQHAFIAGTIIGIVAGIIGYFAVLKQLCFACHALGHIGFAGACGAVFLGLSLLNGQLLLTFIAAMVMVFLGDRIQKNDIVIAIILAFSLGLGSLFLYLNNHYAGSATRILFGDLFVISMHDLSQIVWLGIVCIAAIAIVARPLWFSSLLPELAVARGLRVNLADYIFFGALAIVVTLVSKAVGILLIFTLLIGPSSIALKFRQGFWSGIGLSILFNLIFIYSGLILASITNWPLSFWISAIVLFAFTLTYTHRSSNAG